MMQRSSLVIPLLLLLTGCAAGSVQETGEEPLGRPGPMLGDLSGIWVYELAVVDEDGVRTPMDTVEVRFTVGEEPLPPRRYYPYEIPSPEEVLSSAWEADLTIGPHLRLIESPAGIFQLYSRYLDSAFKIVPSDYEPMKSWVNNPADVMRVISVTDSTLLGRECVVVEVANTGAMLKPSVIRWAAGVGLVSYSEPLLPPRVVRPRPPSGNRRAGRVTLDWGPERIELVLLERRR